jgi:hypothetical protein
MKMPFLINLSDTSPRLDCCHLSMLVKLEYDPAIKERAALERQVKSMRKQLEATSHRFEKLAPPHSPLLTRRPVTAGASSPMSGTVQFGRALSRPVSRGP